MNNKSIFINNITTKFSCKKIFLSVNLILVGLISGCATPNPLANQPTDFCEYVDPTSKYYNPDVLTLEQLGICRTQAEKILSIQTMKIQIHQQRERSINNLSTTPPNGKEINTALNQLSTNQPQQITTENPQSQNRQRTARAQPININQAVNSSAKPTSQIIVQKTHPNLGEQSIQQHYLDQRNNRATQQKLDQEQAKRIAGEVTALLGDPTAQEKLSAPRLLSPGEETRNPTQNNSNSSNTAVANKEQASSSTQPSNPTNNTPSTPKTGQTVTNATNTVNNATSNTLPTANASDAKTEKTNMPSADYTNQPKNIPPTATSAPNNNSSTSSGQASNNNSTTGTQSVTKPPVAEVVKPNTQSSNTPQAVSPVNPTPSAKPVNEQNKNIGGYQAQPLPTLNEQDPLLLLQQRRAQNKQ